VDLKSNIFVLIKRGSFGDIQRHRGDKGKTEAENELRSFKSRNVKDGWETPEAKGGKARLSPTDTE
jgi:hypothetical protein